MYLFVTFLFCFESQMEMCSIRTKDGVVGHWQRTMPETPDCGSRTPKLLMQLWHIVDQAIISSRVWYSEAGEGSCFTKLPSPCDC